MLSIRYILIPSELIGYMSAASLPHDSHNFMIYRHVYRHITPPPPTGARFTVLTQSFVNKYDDHSKIKSPPKIINILDISARGFLSSRYVSAAR